MRLKDENIRIGFDHHGIESTFMATVLCRNNPNVIFEFKPDERGRDLSSIFDGIAKIQFTEKPITFEQSLELFGNRQKYNPQAHICQMYLDTFEGNNDNYIPFMRFSQKDVEKSYKILTKFNRPIIINPMAGQYKLNGDINKHYRMMPIDKWNEIISSLKMRGHDILYVGRSDNYIPLERTEQFFNLSLRETMALIKVCGFYLGIENGMFHGAVASGAKCFLFIPSVNDDYRKFFWPNFVYKPEFWRFERQRVWNHTFTESDIDTFKYNFNLLYENYF